MVITSNLKILIDADMFVFRACASAETTIHWGDDIYTLHVHLSEAKANFINTLEDAIEKALKSLKYSGEFTVVFCFTDPKENFRKRILPTYKANRSGKRRPVCFGALSQWVKDNYESLQIDTLEADDCIGIESTNPAYNGNTLIISGDKDMKCLPAPQYDFIREEFHHINKDEADYHFFKQTLMGDTTDGYSGCPTVGKVSAQRILDKDCTWQAVVNAYEKQKLSEQDALTQARVARILRYEDYDFKAKEVKLWKPTNAPLPKTN